MNIAGLFLAGYPIRMTHVEFLDKYHALKPSVLPPNERVACQSLAAAVTSLSPTDCQVGTTRVFLRNGKTALVFDRCIYFL